MAAADDSEPQGVSVPIVWTGIEDAPAIFANQFIAQVDRGEVFITAGQMAPPVLVGTLEERRHQAENIQFVPVQTVARIACTPSRLRELVNVLQITLNNYEEQEKLFGDPRNG